jgi:hypothetical protein
MNICFLKHVLFPGLLEAVCRKAQPLFLPIYSIFISPRINAVCLRKSPISSKHLYINLRDNRYAGYTLLHSIVAEYRFFAEIEECLCNPDL